MNLFAKTLSIQTSKRFEFVNITSKVQDFVSESGAGEGFVLLRCPHTTAALVCNERDSDVHKDFATIFNKLVPEDENYKHTMEGIDNARAHQLAMLLGSSLWVPVNNGKLDTGTWQSLFFVELLEPRARQVTVLVVG